MLSKREKEINVTSLIKIFSCFITSRTSAINFFAFSDFTSEHVIRSNYTVLVNAIIIKINACIYCILCSFYVFLLVI